MFSVKRVTKIFSADLLQKSFTALDQLSFDVPKREIIGFLGANGAGKTTTLKIVMNFIHATSGVVEFQEEMGRSRDQILQNIGYLPERPYFYPHLTGEEFLHYMGGLNNLYSKSIKERIVKWGPRFKIDFALKRKISTYSKGMLQRLGFLATILHEPKLVILDEPLSGLDPIGRKDLKDVMKEIHLEGKTVFFSSHIISDVEEICKHVVFIKDGKLSYQGGLSALLAQNINPQFEIRYQLPDGPVLTKKIESQEKDQFIKQIVAQGAILEIVRPETVTLEQVIYKTEQNG